MAIQIIGTSDQPKYKWAGIPFMHRYSKITLADRALVAKIVEYDSSLDLKLYMPSEKWHLVRYLSNDRSGKFTRVWELDDKPELGLQRYPGYWILDALRMADLHGAAENRIEEMDKHNEAIDAANDRAMSDHCKDFASEIRKPLIQLEEQGPNSSYKGVF